MSGVLSDMPLYNVRKWRIAVVQWFRIVGAGRGGGGPWSATHCVWDIADMAGVNINLSEITREEYLRYLIWGQSLLER